MKTIEEKNRLAVDYFENVLLNSWTFKRMTEEEQDRLKRWFYRIFSEQDCNRLTGTSEQRKKQTSLLYGTFLRGLGYADGLPWRESEKEIPLF